MIEVFIIFGVVGFFFLLFLFFVSFEFFFFRCLEVVVVFFFSVFDCDGVAHFRLCPVFLWFP